MSWEMMLWLVIPTLEVSKWPSLPGCHSLPKRWERMDLLSSSETNSSQSSRAGWTAQILTPFYMTLHGAAWFQQMGLQTLMQILAWVIIKTIIFILDITFMPLLSLPRLILLGVVPMKTRLCIMSEILWNPRELTPNILSQGQKIGIWALPGQMGLLLLLGTQRTRNQPQKVSMLGMLSTFMDLP